MKYDVIIIGSGPGGYVAAIRAAQLGLKTAVVEREHLGGVCLNWGCIPTKALLRSAEVFSLLRHAEDYGLAADNVRFDAGSVVQRSRDVAARLSRGVEGLLKKNRVEVIWGEARLSAPGRVTVSDLARRPNRPISGKPDGVLGPGDYFADHVVIATGARPRRLPGLEPDSDHVWTYIEAMTPKRIPDSVLVVGASAIGVEFASFYGDLGSKVVVVEMLTQILPAEDDEIAKFARAQFERQGIAIRTGARVVNAKPASDGRLVATIEASGASEDVAVDAIIVAAGVQGNVEDLGLTDLGVAMERGCIAVDGGGRTNVQGVYAIGDVAGPPMLAHKAEHEAVICAEAIGGLQSHPLDRLRIPSCTYSRPQIASVGLTEAKARTAGYNVRVGRFPYAGNGKAIALGEDRGLVKTIFDAGDGKLLGAHMVGAEVTELIQGFVIAMNLETTEDELMHAVFPHPTLSETMHESVMDAYGRAIHK
ncbi:dihydrolipoyl dehydrogenase [Roseiarcus sp.]|uniref:dihydrolipoyl dehydrogenase n=1 Tax=Roseiarcus sp. TaxID=1969460 RepID=UPI003F94AE42